MEPLIPLFLMAALLATLLLGPPVLTARRRQRLQRTPFPAEWERILFGRLRFYPRMPELLRQELRRHIPVFLAEKRFYGCGGLEINEAYGCSSPRRPVFSY
jgi:MtfA peptidase